MNNQGMVFAGRLACIPPLPPCNFACFKSFTDFVVPNSFVPILHDFCVPMVGYAGEHGILYKEANHVVSMIVFKDFLNQSNHS